MTSFRSTAVAAVVLIASCAGFIAPPSAVAWQATVLPEGATTIDVAANDDRASGYFLTLATDATFTVTLSGSKRTATQVELFIPARAPESGRAAGELPTLQQANGSDVPPARIDPPEHEEEPSTGLRFERISTLRVPRGFAQFRVTNGHAANRALVVVRTSSGPTEFELDQPATVPRAVAGMRAWYDAPGESVPRDVRKRGAIAVWGAIIGFGIVASMIALAIWWGTRGRSEARRPKR